MAETTIDGVRLSYAVEGRKGGPFLLLSNPLGTSRGVWDGQRGSFARTFRVVRYDTRGHGDSAAPVGEYALDQLGRDALGILDAAGAERAHVAGISLGGLTAMWLAIHAPSHIEKIVLANTAARIATREHWQERIEQVRAHGFSAIAAAAPPRWFTDGFCRAHPETVSAYQAMLTGCSRDGYIGCCAALRDADLRAQVHQISAPTLAITGTFDPVSPPSDARFLCEHIAAARYVELDAAHFTNVERNEEFASAVLDFLES